MDPAQAYYDECMKLQTPMKEALKRGDSRIQEWYQGSTVFVTGASGFLGKLLVEKLIRTCKIKKIYVLIRTKKGKTVQERLNQLLEDPVYELLHKEQPSFPSLIQGVEGDTSELRLGIGSSNWETLVREVQLIFHLAATTRFDEALKKATLTNVRGTREVLDLAKQCKNLRSFVHVSTAYTHATYSNIGKEVCEQFYDTPILPDTLICLVETVSEDRIQNITTDLIRGWPNTYSFTKAVSEELIRNSTELPICIVRPPIVFGSYFEPIPGYVDFGCAYGPTGLTLGGVLGIIRVLWVNKEVKLCYVPADLVINATIACAWNVVQKDIIIYNLSNSRCNIKFDTITQIFTTEGRSYPSPKAIWYSSGLQIERKWIYSIYSLFLHYIPAYLVDIMCKIFGIDLPKGIDSFVAVYKKLDKMMEVFNFYLTNEWIIKDDNSADLYNSLSDTDKDIFFFDIMKVNWNQMLLAWGMGVRKFLIKDGLNNTLYAVKKQNYFYIANCIVFFLCFCFLWFISSCLIKMIF